MSNSTFGHNMQQRNFSVEPEVSEFTAQFPDSFPIEYTPSINYCLVGKARPKEQTKGGIIMPDSTVKGDQTLSQVGKIMAVGPLFYGIGSAKLVPDDDVPKVGDFVYFMPYTGNRMKLRSSPDDLFILITDQEIMMRIKDKDAVSNLQLFA
jgi:co-chaperonin GroES (HSP10)